MRSAGANACRLVEAVVAPEAEEEIERPRHNPSVLFLSGARLDGPYLAIRRQIGKLGA
jgi:hypothetical protein